MFHSDLDSTLPVRENNKIRWDQKIQKAKGAYARLNNQEQKEVERDKCDSSKHVMLMHQQKYYSSQNLHRF